MEDSTKYTENLTRCLTEAKTRGVPRDQAQTLVESHYIPLPWQWSFHAAAREADKPDGPVEIGAGGARGPGKSHGIFAQAGLDDAQRVEGLKILFLRKTAISAKESFDDLIEKVLQGAVKFSRANNTIVFPNKSRILLGGFHNEKDIDKYIGIEYDLIVVEELNQLTEEKFLKLKGSLRTSKPNWRPRIYASFNPGGIGHQFVKTRFVLPHRLREETKTRFIPATYKTNPYLNKEYTDYLEELTGDLGRAWREGDFDLFAGQFFKEWRHDVHVCDPFEIPKDWKRIKAGDAGYNQPSIGWYAISPDGQAFRYRELYPSEVTASELAAMSVELTNPDEKISYEVWDPAFWAKKGDRDDTLSGAEVYQNKIKELTGKAPHMVKGENPRISGWMVMREWIKPFMKEDVMTANLQIFSTCTEAIRTIPEQQHDEKNPEDLDTDGEDHIADEIRYFCMSRPTPAVAAEELEDKLFKMAMHRKNAKRNKAQKDMLFYKRR